LLALARVTSLPRNLIRKQRVERELDATPVRGLCRRSGIVWASATTMISAITKTASPAASIPTCRKRLMTGFTGSIE
jgi:hypothetical protein